MMQPLRIFGLSRCYGSALAQATLAAALVYGEAST